MALSCRPVETLTGLGELDSRPRGSAGPLRGAGQGNRSAMGARHLPPDPAGYFGPALGTWVAQRAGLRRGPDPSPASAYAVRAWADAARTGTVAATGGSRNGLPVSRSRRRWRSSRQLGAPLWAERTQAELRRIGLRPAAPLSLTPTEERVADLVATGHTNREVAQALFLSVHTVEDNLRRIYRKLGVRSRTELAAVYSAKGIRALRVDPGNATHRAR